MKKRMLTLLLAIALCVTPACAASQTFSDVADGAWYADAVAYCSEQGLMTAMPDGSFSPNIPATRAMLVTGLYRQAGSPAVTGSSTFTDVSASADYHNAVVWATEKNIVSGYTDGRFGPNDEVTREQFAAILWRSAGKPAAQTAEPFADQAQIAGYAADAVAWAKNAGVIHGRENNVFDPRANITRGEAAVMLYQWSKNTAKTETPAAGAGQPGGSGGGTVPTTQESTETKLLITVGGREFTATLADTDAAREFAGMLPLTFDMSELNGNEKYAYLDRSLPTAAHRPDGIHAGDLMLYGSSCVVLFYESFSTAYSYTSLGHLDDPAGLADAVGSGSVTVTFRLAGTKTPPAVTGSKTLVAYFSATGTTRPLAEDAADILGADLYEIVPEIPYTADDLKYYTNCRADREQNDPTARPVISGSVADMSQYDVVFIGYPIWHGQAPRIISTFLESYDFTGKTIVPFCTSHSSGYSDSTIKPLAPGTNWLTGRRFAAGTSRSALESWINGLELPEPKEANMVRAFDFETKTVTLNSGYVMPINGLGTYSLHGDTCVNAVKSALANGVRLIDTAHMYGNEEEIGQAIREAMEEYGIRREEIFVITKIYPGEDMANPEQSIQACLDRLNIGYVDMMLLHHPDPNDVKAYKAMEQFAADGKIRSLGLSNWYVSELKSFLPQVNITPALVQNEIHPYYQENDVIPYIQDLGIVVQGWYPLGGRGHTAALLGDETISAIAKAHGVSSAQVILRWNLQKGVVVIPGSSNPEHIKENTELYHFALTADEMSRMNALDRGEKHDWY